MASWPASRNGGCFAQHFGGRSWVIAGFLEEANNRKPESIVDVSAFLAILHAHADLEMAAHGRIIIEPIVTDFVGRFDEDIGVIGRGPKSRAARAALPEIRAALLQGFRH